MAGTCTDLHGQVAVVTGASAGIGAAVACAIASAGGAVTIDYQSHDAAAHRLVEEIVKAGGRAIAVKAAPFMSISPAPSAKNVLSQHYVGSQRSEFPLWVMPNMQPGLPELE